jgi:hypothetical protein
MSKIIYALIVIATQGGTPGYEKVYATEAGCQRAVATQTATNGAADAWCVQVEIALEKKEN